LFYFIVLLVTRSLPDRRTRLSTVGDRAFPVASARICNNYCVTSRPHHFCLFPKPSENAPLPTVL